jgi:hypothetical protein
MHVAKYSTNPRSEGMNEFSRSGLLRSASHETFSTSVRGPLDGVWLEGQPS